MTSTTKGFGTDVELRERNRAVVEAYLDQIAGQKRLTRHELFAEDGSAGLWTTETGEPIVISGIDKLAKHAVWSLESLPDWRWYNIEVFETQDPGRFWVECDGEGKIIFPGHPVGHYRNHFLHYFRLEDGKIKEQREYMNPVMQMRALGLDIPKVQRGEIPADK
ncbi:ketosteroid isomerase-like protein [Kibdelosporangium banguiense]|uniref:Ketosteroid isomerase-like protein n=1 Tax=Kibdelosporangium banguiense TaxID=1365924 RepID=A0ABS4TKU0_9PSEU|nr:PhzA/PhzB family protein [Kibdelosporangium banguiense]MBP2324996.1 ketosteroid isomerase-like protein [Kibdelosporangium banguiense]